ncbi:hypothetical protein BT96DRAFT_980509 [Gymnopus androsaceus JB14]|uniref:F-box domain-containing protein n=1 Tax=Gymnopus androsaceus JB14 TaxID=1447944 RepID=A0A6A4GW32_9AGAR|nr:hypothetical protein BT96DRAFT_980509 [Gymnopus androsaceus JB14]
MNFAASVFFERLRRSEAHQTSDIVKFLKEIDSEVDRYTTKISALETEIALLNSQRQRLQSHRTSISFLLSPIHRLPNELLTRIFTLACEKNVLNSDPGFRDGVALRIAGVSFRWRVLAIACSEIWSSIVIQLHDGTEPEEVRLQLEHQLDIYLERSKDQRLTLEIYVGVPWRQVVHDPLITKLVQHSARWQHLTLHDGYQVEEADIRNLRTHVPLPSTLETLTIRIGPQPFPLSWIPSPNSLRIMDIDTYLPGVEEGIIPPPMDKVTSLTFIPKLDSLFEPLNWFPNIEHLALTSAREFIEAVDVSNGSPHIVPITSLEINFLSQLSSNPDPTLDFLQIVMDFLTAPALSTLSINEIDTGVGSGVPRTSDQYSFTCISTFIERSGCRLSVLELSGLFIQDRSIVDLLKKLSSLVELHIHDPLRGRTDARSRPFPISKDLIESLHAYQPSSLHLSISPIVPNLSVLVLKVQSRKFDHLSFVSTILSRWIPTDKLHTEDTGVSCLRSVELHILEPVNEEVYLPLVPAGKSGMRIVVKRVRN